MAEEEEERETKDIKEREKRQDTKMVQAKRDLQEKAILLREEMVKLLQRPRGEAFVRRSKTVRFIYSTMRFTMRFGDLEARVILLGLLGLLGCVGRLCISSTNVGLRLQHPYTRL